MATASQTSQATESALQALWVLSGFKGQVTGGELSELIAEAPDAETACRIITNRMRVSSDALTSKWRKVIIESWHEQHPQAAQLTLPISSQEVAETGALRDVYAFLHAVEQQPPRLVEEEDGQRHIHPDDLSRLIEAVPSLRHRFVSIIEHELACVPLHRLRHLLQTLRLVRPLQGKLVLVRSRYERFQDLPFPQQFYLLWHTDVYHVDWAAYAPGWQEYVTTAQQYLPLLWEISHEVDAGSTEDIQDVSNLIMEMFTEAWEEENLLRDSDEGGVTLLDVYKQTTLPGVMQRLVVDDLFIRYGLVESMNVVNVFLSRRGQVASQPGTAVEWTQVGQHLLELEHDQHHNLPCSLDILK